ncbi:MAG TPA: hypothetical protein VF765_28250 [Polyangiaceae bacterium]
MSLRRALWFAALAGAAAVATVASVACLDLTPVVYEAPSSDDGPVMPMPDVVVTDNGPTPEGSRSDAAVDGDASAPEVVVPPTCIGCLNTPDDASPPGCASEIAACNANTKCAATYVCAVADNCFKQPSFRDIVNCGIPCAEDAGIVSSSDPAVQLIYNIAVCASCNCNAICAVGDAGPSCGD